MKLRTNKVIWLIVINIVVGSMTLIQHNSLTKIQSGNAAQEKRLQSAINIIKRNRDLFLHSAPTGDKNLVGSSLLQEINRVAEETSVGDRIKSVTPKEDEHKKQSHVRLYFSNVSLEKSVSFIQILLSRHAAIKEASCSINRDRKQRQLWDVMLEFTAPQEIFER